jgi:hypothetical protein
MEAADSIHDCVDEDMYEDVIKFIAYDCLNVDLPTLIHADGRTWTVAWGSVWNLFTKCARLNIWGSKVIKSSTLFSTKTSKRNVCSHQWSRCKTSYRRPYCRCVSGMHAYRNDFWNWRIEWWQYGDSVQTDIYGRKSICETHGTSREFIVDDSTPVVRLFDGHYNFVMRQVLKKIRFDAPTVDTSQKVAEEWINTVIKTSSWTCYTCDAGFMDAANHIPQNRSQTYWHVFKQYCSNVQIDLQGGDHS